MAAKREALRQMVRDANFREFLAEYRAKLESVDTFRFCSVQCAEKFKSAAHCPHSRSYFEQQQDYGWRY